MKLRAFVFGLFFLLQNSAAAETWNLPQHLNSSTTQITFEVDSTWHLIRGVVKQIEGNLWIEDPKDFHTVRGKIVLPISAFDTNNESRDEELRTVMHAETSPDVAFELLNSVPLLCDPETLKESQKCPFEISGDLTINNVTRNISLKSEITSIGSSYKISGTTTIRWADYNVEDPSILIAKLYDDVKINFSVLLDPTYTVH